MNDHLSGPDTASAGNNGQSVFALDLTQPDWNDSDRGTLNSNGINVIRRMFGGIRNYGWRSQANPNTDSNWLSFANGRLYMGIAAELRQAGENYVFSTIDGQLGQTIQSFKESLISVLSAHWRKGELFLVISLRLMQSMLVRLSIPCRLSQILNFTLSAMLR